MKKDDKQFIADLINGLDIKMDGVDKRLLKQIKINQKGIQRNRTSIQENKKGIQENQFAIKANKEGIHNNGIILEKLEDLIGRFAENLFPRMDHLEGSLKKIQKNTQNLPILYTMVKKHERQLAELRI